MNAHTYNDTFDNGLRPDPDLDVCEWADAHRILPKKSSSEPGKYRSSRVPFCREIMNALSPSSPVQEICVQKGVQLGFTELANCWFGFIVDVSPGPMMMIFPTAELAKDHSRQKLAPTINETPRLKGKVREARSRDSGNTLSVKEFPGGILFMSGSNSGAFFRSKSIRYLFLDDIDGFDHDVGGEGDPADLARKRTDTFGSRKKILEVSTPTVKGVSRIERSFLESDQRFYFVPCPHCNEYQRLLWSGIKFDRDQDGRVIDVFYACASCHERIDEFSKTEMLERGKWVPSYPERQKRGYQISSLYSPLGWVSWRQIVQEFLEAKAFKERLKVWTNTRLGETFEEAGDSPDWILLKSRCESYSILTVPVGGLILTAGVDVQDNRLAVVIRAWGRGEESWLIYWGEIYGNPGEAQVWTDLDLLISRQFDHVSGSQLQIVSAAIDSGGHFTQDVYSFCRRKSPRVFAIRGSSLSGRPILGHPSTVDLNWRGQILKNGIQIFPVGSDTCKGMIYSRLKITTPGPGYYHFPIGIGDEYFTQLTSEKLITKYVKGYPRLEWTLTGPRNEALDCEVYAYAAAIRAGIVHTDWNRLEKAILRLPDAPKPHAIDPQARPIPHSGQGPARKSWMSGFKNYRH